MCGFPQGDRWVPSSHSLCSSGTQESGWKFRDHVASRSKGVRSPNAEQLVGEVGLFVGVGGQAQSFPLPQTHLQCRPSSQPFLASLKGRGVEILRFMDEEGNIPSPTAFLKIFGGS